MKKSIVVCMCFIAGIAMAQVQTETLTLKAVKKGEEPKGVMDAIKKDFPKAIVSDLAILPGKLYGEQWSVDFKDDLNGATPELYRVNLKEGSESYQAVYDKSGKMLSSKTIIKEAQLPAGVTKTISAKYPDWKVANDREKITYKKGALKEVYHVQIHQNNTYRSLFLDGSGRLIKNKLIQHPV
jgi:hypothetical protein